MISMQSMREQVFAHVAETYHVSPDYPWMRYPRYAVFRHAGSGKWFGLVMDVPREKLGLDGRERVDILNVKMNDPRWAALLVEQPGYLRGYHISRGNWVSILLDGTVSPDEICERLAESFTTTASRAAKR